MSELFRPLILNAIPEQHWPALTRCATDGVALADNLIASQRMLDWSLGQDQRGDLRRIGVMYCIREACLKEILPFTCETKNNTAKNCHHIEVAAQNLYFHVTRTSHFSGMPRDTTLRDNERVSNQGDLFEGTLLTTDLSLIKRWYGYLTFAADFNGLITHLALGLPESVGSGWLDIVSVLKEGGQEAQSPQPEPEPPGPEETTKFHKHIEENFSKSRNESGAKEK